MEAMKITTDNKINSGLREFSIIPSVLNFSKSRAAPKATKVNRPGTIPITVANAYSDHFTLELV